MKIIATVTNDLSADQRMHRICMSLSDAGYDVLLVGRKLRDSVALSSQKYKQFRIRCWFNSGKLFYLEYNFRLFFYLLTTKFDIVNGVDVDTLIPCFLTAKIKRKPVVFDSHELFSEVPEVVDRKWVQRIWQMVEDFFIPKIKYCYTVSDSLVNYYKSRYNVDFLLIRNLPLNVVINQNSVKASDKYLIYQGALNKGRGLEFLLLAVRCLDANLLMVGKGDLEHELKELVRHYSLEDKVKFEGFVMPDKLKELTMNAYIGLNLLDDSSKSYYFSLANKCLDYIQCEIPQICMNFPEYQKINQKYSIGLLLDSLDVEELVTKINMLLLNENLYRELKENTLIAKTKLNWEVEQQNLVKMYGEIRDELSHKTY